VGHYAVQGLVLDGAHRIDHRGGVHPEADKYWEEALEVFVFGGERGHDKSKAQGRGAEQHHQHWE